MIHEDYEAAANQFQKAIEISKDTWYFYQTYIKLGICNKELENFDTALDNLHEGMELTNKASIDETAVQLLPELRPQPHRAGAHDHAGRGSLG